MYKTRQKELIINLLKENNDISLSAIDIVNKLKNIVSKATIYRQLDNLYQKKEINKFYNENLNRYEYAYDYKKECMSHLHLKCNKCGKVFHLNNEVSNYIVSTINFNIDFKNSLIYGTCNNCK